MPTMDHMDGSRYVIRHFGYAAVVAVMAVMAMMTINSCVGVIFHRISITKE